MAKNGVSVFEQGHQGVFSNIFTHGYTCHTCGILEHVNIQIEHISKLKSASLHLIVM